MHACKQVVDMKNTLGEQFTFPVAAAHRGAIRSTKSPQEFAALPTRFIGQPIAHLMQ